MAVHIRLSRIGAKKRPFYRIIVADHRSPNGGRFLENIGTYDPTSEPVKFTIDAARLQLLAQPRRASPRRRSIELIKRQARARRGGRGDPVSLPGAETSMPLKELIQAIAVELVDHPDQVEVTEIAGDNNSVIELRVAKEDIGKVIGKEGRTAQSMRAILTAVSAKLGRRAHLDIVDWAHSRARLESARCVRTTLGAARRGRAPHGVRGELRLRLYNRDSDLLLEQDEVLLRFPDGEEQEVSVDGARRADDAILMRLHSVDDRDRAEELRGGDRLRPPGRISGPLAEGEFYACDIEGARVVVDEEGAAERELGQRDRDARLPGERRPRSRRRPTAAGHGRCRSSTRSSAAWTSRPDR